MTPSKPVSAKTIVGWTCLALIPGAIVGAIVFHARLKNRPRGQVKGSSASFGFMVGFSALAVVLLLVFLALVVHKHPLPK
jgi:hypothetical protein